MVKEAKVRLFVEAPLSGSSTLLLDPDAAHYVTKVMRLGIGDPLVLFNGHDGEWRADIQQLARRECVVAINESLRPQAREPVLWVAAAPIKRARMEVLVEKATELGGTHIQPVITRRTTVPRTNIARLTAQAKEAAEQCGRLSVPSVAEPMGLERFLESTERPCQILWCDESGESPPVSAALGSLTDAAREGPWVLLIGPEGGFDPVERELIGNTSHVLPVDLGPLVLRSETAAIVALGILQSWMRAG